MTQKQMTFTEVLQQLGHIYEPRPEDMVAQDKVRHILKVYKPTGNVQAICGSTSVRGMGCPALSSDADCLACREIAKIVPAITKRSLMLDLVNALCDTEQTYIDAMYWNFHNRDQTMINPDPDGDLASSWLAFSRQLLSMVERFGPTMENHEAQFGWPTDLEGD